MIDQAAEDRRKRFTALARSFPSVRDHDNLRGIDPWNGPTLDETAFESALGSGATCAVQFLLYVWNPYTQWRMGKFDLARCGSKRSGMVIGVSWRENNCSGAY